jgi:hypothetical protein
VLLYDNLLDSFIMRDIRLVKLFFGGEADYV